MLTEFFSNKLYRIWKLIIQVTSWFLFQSTIRPSFFLLIFLTVDHAFIYFSYRICLLKVCHNSFWTFRRHFYSFYHGYCVKACQKEIDSSHFPTVNSRHGVILQENEKLRQESWLRNVRLKESDIKKHSTVCSRHFISGTFHYIFQTMYKYF